MSSSLRISLSGDRPGEFLLCTKRRVELVYRARRRSMRQSFRAPAVQSLYIGLVLGFSLAV